MIRSITQRELERMLMATDRCQFVSLTCITDPEMRKRNNPFFGAVRKVSIASGVVCWQYERTVNRQRSREGAPTDFKARRRAWGSRIKNTPLVSHVTADGGETRLYLEVKIERSHAHYFDRTTGKKIEGDSLEALRKYFPKRSGSGRQHVERPVVLRDYRILNIAELTIAGKRYKIAPADAELAQYFPQSEAPATAQPELKPDAEPGEPVGGRS